MDEPIALTVKTLARLRDLRFVGEFDAAEAERRGLTLIESTHGAQHAADHIRLMLLVDQGNRIVAVRYRTLATGGQLALYDLLAERCEGLTLEQAAALTPASLERELRDEPGAAAVSGASDQPFYVLVKALERLHGVASTPPPTSSGGTAELPWAEVGLFEKVRRIESVLDQHVRAALASDGGGIDLVDLKGDQLFVQYHGACGSCSSSIGGTLQFISDSLNNYLGTQLTIQVTGYEEDGPAII